MNDHAELYQQTLRRKWRWRYVAANGNILADSGQGYSRRIDAVNALCSVTGTKPVYTRTPSGAATLYLVGTAQDGNMRRLHVDLP